MIFVALLFFAVIGLSFHYLGTHNIAVLNPKGMIAAKQKQLFITTSLIMLIVVIPAIVLAFAFAWRYRHTNKNAKYTPEWAHNTLAEIIWWGVPFAIVVVLSFITYFSTHELNPFNPIVNGKKPLKIQVVALEWKWLFIYPEQGIATVNYVQIPEKTPIDFEITADAPMNSFWIPQLGGQIYAMPAMRTEMHLIADEPGEYRGSSSHISGKGFAGMHFVTKATSEQDFERWVSKARSSSKTLNAVTYKGLVVPSENNKPTLYVLGTKNLFDQIIDQYKAPAKVGK